MKNIIVFIYILIKTTLIKAPQKDTVDKKHHCIKFCFGANNPWYNPPLYVVIFLCKTPLMKNTIVFIYILIKTPLMTDVLDTIYNNKNAHKCIESELTCATRQSSVAFWCKAQLYLVMFWCETLLYLILFRCKAPLYLVMFWCEIPFVQSTVVFSYALVRIIHCCI